MAELKAAPLFGSVRLQRLTRGYTTARTPVSPAASVSAVAPPPPPPRSRSRCRRRCRGSRSHQLPRRNGYPCVHHGVYGCTVCRENKKYRSMVRCSRSSRIVKPSRSAGFRRREKAAGIRVPARGPSTGAGTGAG
ncbi:hypothetical protein ALC60_07117 [Trachymyrmex zeteki]|uniref:Uncharacterized protein n=1 Tax=Mycetomoellerius zeteki TaxID=64791 RepID=A0A151X0Q1_9HYME|nr:hypothetical protein ALC60_07117 [Trachymyrmex zeteki]